MNNLPIVIEVLSLPNNALQFGHKDSLAMNLENKGHYDMPEWEIETQHRMVFQYSKL